MRIALVSDGIHPYVMGGMQRHTYYLCKYLSRRGVRVTLVHYNAGNMDIEKLGVFTEDEKKNIESIVLTFPESDRWPGHYVRASYRYSELAWEKLKDRLGEFDFIYTKGFSGWKLIEEKNRHPENFPPVGVKFHGYEMFQKQADFRSWLKSWLLRGPVKRISRMADVVFSYGPGITRIISSLGVRPERIVEVPAGIEPDWIGQTELSVSSPRVFTYLGRYERRKGTEELNDVINELLKQDYPFRFQFIGPFEEYRKIGSSQVKYFGMLTDNEKIREILSSTDFLVCPSWSEGMPNVILEAMACGCAVIASDVGAVSVMAGKENAILTKPGNKAELKAAIIKAVEMDSDSVLSMKQASREIIKTRFRYDIIMDMFLQKIQQLIRSYEHH